MKKIVKAAILLAFLSLGGWSLAAQTRIYQARKADDKVNQKQSAGNLYLKNCARCHDADGKSQSKLGITLEASDLTSREVQQKSQKSIIKVITQGEGAMPAFGKKLSKNDIKALAGFVHTF